jgi:hypothetical protein
MGRPIVYCDICGTLLREEDFAKGRAHEVDHRNFCVACRPLPAAPAPVPSPPGGFKKAASSGRIPVPRPPSKPAHAAVPPAPPPPSRTGLYLGVGAGAVVLLGLIVAVASSGRGPAPSGETEIGMRPATRPAPETTRSPAVETASREPLLRAIAFRRANPNDLAGQIRAFEAALQAVAGTFHEADAKRELAAVGQRIRSELAEVEKQAAPFQASEEYGKAIGLLEAARRRYDQIDWTRGLDPLLARVQDALAKSRADVQAQANDARRRQSEDDLARLRARVARWEVPSLEAALAPQLVVAPPAPTPDPAPAPPPPAAPAADPAAATRALALAHCAARDYEAALAALGPLKADADLVREARTAAVEGAAQLLKAKGKKLLVDYLDATGSPARVDDVLLRADATRIEMKLGADSVVIPLGEVAARTLAAQFRARPGAKPDDARAAAALCWLEGDVEGAQGAALPDGLKGAPPPPDEDARRAFYAAEALHFEPGRSLDAQAAYRALLAEKGETAFVRRNRAAIQARLETPREWVGLAEDLAGSGGFKLVPNRKVEKCWTSEKDVDGPEAKGNFVEAAFTAGPDRPVRAFVYVGGCCAETFLFHAQGTELKSPDGKTSAEPGGEAALVVKHTITGLKRRHQDHLGPKEPDRWEWVTIVLPKYAEAGRKVLRLLSDQKGFSVGMVVVSGERTTPPRDLDAKEVEQHRADVPGYLSRGGVQLGSLLREVYRGIGGGGVDDLRNNPAFPDRPAETARIRAFESPQDIGDDYGQRIRGYVHPPASGDYVFWIASDDQGMLWLSPDADPKNKVQIANVREWTPPRQYDKWPEQKSKPVRLEAGRRYYIEAVHKEGGGGDHVSVRWQLPDGSIEAPIPGSRLSPWTGK